MGKKAIAKTYNQLVENIWVNVLFYIPESNLVKMFLKKLKGLEEIDTTTIYNKVFVIDVMLGPIVLKEKANYQIGLKKEMLEDNIYLLLKKKKRLNKLEFEFILDRYFEQVELFFYISNWISEDLKTNTQIKISDKTKGLLKFQYKYYKTHFESLIKYFYPKLEKLPTGNFDVQATLEKYFPRIIKHTAIESINSIQTESLLGEGSKNYNNITDAIELADESNNKNSSTKNIIKGKETQSSKKQSILTKEQAKQFLLASVFNISE